MSQVGFGPRFQVRIKMKKIAILLLSFALAGITSANAVEVTLGMQDVDNHVVATKGKNYAVAWTTYNEDQNTAVLYASVKRGSSDWTLPAEIASGDGYIYPDLEILDNGKIVVIAVVNNSFVISSTTKTGTQLGEGEIAPGTNEFYFTHPYELEIYVNGNNLTVTAVVNETGNPEIRTFDLKATDSTWTNKFVMSGFPTSHLEGCEYDVEVCDTNYHLNLSFNKKGQQTLAVMVSLYNYTNEESLETYLLFETQRKTTNGNWQSPVLLERYGPAVIEGWAFWVTGNVTTPKGKSVISWISGFNELPNRGRIAVSKSFGKDFVRTDSATLNTGASSQGPYLLNTGEKVTAVYIGETDNEIEFVYTGDPGNLKKAKKSLLQDHWMVGLFKVNGSMRLVSIKEDQQGNSVTYVTKFKNGNWTTPKAQEFSVPEGMTVQAWGVDVAASSTSIIMSASSFNPEEEIYGAGLDVVISK